jgi:predicted Zn-dependent peptidase
MENNYRLSKLRNGTRIATIEMPWMNSVSVGIWAGIGGRHESEEQCGISHFIEHMLFKGTKRRSAKRITETVEGVGGYLNAFTTEDHTCYYAKGAARHLARLSDVLVDMYVESQLEQPEIDREREVIREEILMYRDHPAQHVQELLSETLWPGHPLGRPLTGTETTISRLQRAELLNFMRGNYNGRSTVVTVAGKATHSEVVAQFESVLGNLPEGQVPRYRRWRERRHAPRISMVPEETEQTHLAMAFHAFGRHDERRFALKLLSVMLGENMSSRLFQRLREQHGFCYSVQSGVVTLSDSGALNVTAGLDPAKLERALRMILREFKQMCSRSPSRSELRNAKDYTIGQTELGLESTTNQIMWMGESVLGYGRLQDLNEIERRVMAVTPEDIQAVACYCLDQSRLALAIVGPAPDESRIRACLN